MFMCCRSSCHRLPIDRRANTIFEPFLLLHWFRSDGRYGWSYLYNFSPVTSYSSGIKIIAWNYNQLDHFESCKEVHANFLSNTSVNKTGHSKFNSNPKLWQSQQKDLHRVLCTEKRKDSSVENIFSLFCNCPFIWNSFWEIVSLWTARGGEPVNDFAPAWAGPVWLWQSRTIIPTELKWFPHLIFVGRGLPPLLSRNDGRS